MHIDDSRFFTVQAWMVTKLQLKSIERDVFAIIYGFSQNPDARCYDSYNYLSGITGYSRRAIISAVESLQLKGYIIKSQESISGVIKNRYYHNRELIQLILSGEQAAPCSEQDAPVSGEQDALLSEPDAPINKYNIKEKDNITEKQAEPALHEISSEINPRRNFRKEHEVLEDKLNSGEVIDAEKNKKKLSPAERLQNNCLGEIDKRAYTEDEKELLREYFLWASSGTDVRKIKSLDLWRSKLNALEQIAKSSGDNISDIVRQSIDNKWYKFEQVNRVKATAQHHEPLADEVITGNREEAQKRLDAKRAAGAKVY